MNKLRMNAWIIWMVASLFYAYQYILRVMPNIMLPDIMQQFHIDAAIFGQFSGIYYIGYALMHLPIGIMLDRFGPRKVMTGCILLTVVGLLPLIISHQWIYPVFGRALIGIGSSAAILGTFKIIRMGFPEGQFTRMLSFSVTIGLIGAIYGGGPVSYLVQTWGYHNVIKLFSLVGVGLALFTYFLIPDMEKEPQASIRHDLIQVITNRKILLICISAGCMVGPLEGFADVWGSAFLKQVYELPPAVGNTLPSLIFMGMCFGAPVLSFIAEKSNAYLGTMIAAGITMLSIFLLLLTQQLGTNGISIGFVLVGICCAYQILAIYLASSLMPDHMAGLTTAAANMIIMSFGYAFHSLIGLVVTLSGEHTAGGLAYLKGVSVIPMGIAIGVTGLSLLAITNKYRSSLAHTST